MKEAAGEANMTVITIVLIAIVLGVGALVVSSLMKNTSMKSDCSSQGGTWKGDVCYSSCTFVNSKPDTCSGELFNKNNWNGN